MLPQPQPQPSLPNTQPHITLKQLIRNKITHSSHSNNQIQINAQNLINPSFLMPEEQLKLLQSIQIYQSKHDRGYMKYQQWIHFNNYQFVYVRPETMINLWKIIRIINYGEVLIPTGLIYQISLFFITKNQLKKNQKSSNTLKNVINSYLSLNQMNDSLMNFRELINYPSLQSIQKQYCPNFYQKTSPKSKSIYKHSTQKKKNELFDRLFKQGRTREHSLQRLKYTSIAKQLKQCKFTPTISNFTSKTQTNKYQRICKHTTLPPKQQQIFTHEFIASKIGKDIFKGKLEDVPGVRQHIKRAEIGEAQRRRLQRYIARPWLMVR